MVSSEVDPDQLLLCGFVPWRATGRALPCFSAGSLANTWYTAVTDIEGDAQSKIAGFEEYLGPGVERLPSDLVRPAQKGQPWIEVFTFDGRVYTGASGELLTDLEPVWEKLELRAPLSLFELLSDEASARRTVAAANARRFLAARHGLQEVEDWSVSVLRDAIQLRLRRLLPQARPGDAGLHRLEVHANPQGLQVLIPPVIARSLFADPAMHEWLTDLNGLARDLNLEIAEIGELPPPIPGSRPRQRPQQPSPDKRESSDLLILTEGRRAKQIGRLVAGPDWHPVWTSTREIPAAGGPAVTVTDWGSDVPELERFSAVILCVDDESWTVDLEHAVLALRGRAAKTRTPILLAPALPQHEPSRILMDAGAGAFLTDAVDAVVDTSLARSPLWSGDTGRAVDRSIADILMHAGLLFDRYSPVTRELQALAPKHTPIVQYRIDDGDEEALPGLLQSESFWSEPPDAYFEHRFDARTTTRRRTRLRGLVRAVRPSTDFDRFAHELVRRLGGPDAQRVIPTRDLPWEVAGLPPAGPASAFRLQSPLAGWMLMTAATPTFEQFRGAARHGWWLVRYTDVETIHRLASPPDLRHDLPEVAAELRVDGLSRRPENRGLATRGIDIRDVAPLDADQYEEWRASDPDPVWDDLVRPYRTTVGRPPPALNGERQIAYVVQGPALLEGVRENDPAAHRLMELTGWRGPRSTSGPWPKRLGDLAAAYAEAPPGCRRYIVADGDIPVRVAELADGETPAQNLFLMVGDVAAPALLLSRLFEVWAFFTLSRSRSWPSRFTLSRTFEAFPLSTALWPTRTENGRPFLTLSQDSGLALPFMDLQAHLARRQQWPEPFSGAICRRDLDHDVLRRLLDAPLMNTYDLSPDATDTDILERLLSFNSQQPGSRFVLGRSRFGDRL